MKLWIWHSCFWTVSPIRPNHPVIIFAVCFGLLSCWKTNSRPRGRSRTLWTGFIQKCFYIPTFVYPSVSSSLPVSVKNIPTAWCRKQPCFTVGMILGISSLQTWCLVFCQRVKSVPHQTREFYLSWSESFKNFLVKLVDWCRNVCPSGRFSSPTEQYQHGVLDHFPE